MRGDGMNIREQFNLVAQEYDINRRKFIPCFEEFYSGTTDFISANIAQPRRVLDLGAGTGLLSYYWFQKFPDSEYLLVDIAEEMLNVARRRFAGLDNVSCRILDYTHGLPDEDFDVIISALSVHHLENPDKQRLFADICRKLPEGGLFVNYDQFCAGNEQMNRWFDSYWEEQLAHSGLSDKDIELWNERRRLDRECTAEEETEMLLRCGFSAVKCVYSCRKFSVIAAVK